MTMDGATSEPPLAVVVVGSANMDVVFRVDRIPAPGETLLASSVSRAPGGKGLNQAVAAARAGVSTGFVGAIGQDGDGDAIILVLDADGIRRSRLRRLDDPTGSAFVVVDASGENTIVVAPGANAAIDGIDERDVVAIAGASVLLLQLEVPMQLVLAAARIARDAGTTVVLNAAPAVRLTDDLFATTDIVVVNEHEAIVSTGAADLDAACRVIAGRVGTLVVTLGAQGSVVFEAGREVERVPAHRVGVRDTTGAGDTFCGVLAAALSAGDTVSSAVKRATAAAALSVQVEGATPSIPHRARIDAALAAMVDGETG